MKHSNQPHLESAPTMSALMPSVVPVSQPLVPSKYLDGSGNILDNNKYHAGGVTHPEKALRSRTFVDTVTRLKEQGRVSDELFIQLLARASLIISHPFIPLEAISKNIPQTRNIEETEEAYDEEYTEYDDEDDYEAEEDVEGEEEEEDDEDDEEEEDAPGEETPGVFELLQTTLRNSEQFAPGKFNVQRWVDLTRDAMQGVASPMLRKRLRPEDGTEEECSQAKRTAPAPKMTPTPAPWPAPWPAAYRLTRAAAATAAVGTNPGTSKP